MDKTAKNRIVIRGRVESLSPLHIGCGSDERSDMDILLDEQGKPLIPATALIGLLCHEICFKNGSPEEEKAKSFWGYAEGDAGHQSAIRCQDLICCSDDRRSIRDGIRIDNRRGMVIAQGKYDYEIMEPGAVFSLEMEILLSRDDDGFEERMAATVCRLLESGDLRIGAKTTNGLGRIQLRETNISRFDFSRKGDVLNWLGRRYSEEQAIEVDALGSPFSCGRPNFSILATLGLKSALIIRSYPTDPEMPDAVHIRSNGEPVLTGSSLKGAIRARAQRIAQTFGKGEALVRNLFGYVPEESGGTDGSARKGRVRIDETVLPPYACEMQHRIRIDRFTGGVIEGGLFDSMPLFSDLNKKTFQVAVEVADCTEAEAGLLLLVLKDLWTADLPVGGEKNVGRGLFEGKMATIGWGEKCFVLDGDLSKTTENDREALQHLVTAFHGEKG